VAGKKPDKSFKKGRASVAIWKNEGGADGVFYTATFNRSYKSDDGWKQTQSFGLFDLVDLIWCASEAHSYIAKQIREAEQPNRSANGADAGEESHPE